MVAQKRPDEMKLATPGPGDPWAPTAAVIVLPPLKNGDRLTRAEFERRYDAMSGLKKAELIEGVVYPPSPLRYDRHGRPLLLVGAYLFGRQFRQDCAETRGDPRSAELAIARGADPPPEVVATRDSAREYVFRHCQPLYRLPPRR